MTVKVTTRRLVSFHTRSVAAISYEVEAVDQPMRVAIQSNLLANQRDRPGGDDPRGGQALDSAAGEPARGRPRPARRARPPDAAQRADDGGRDGARARRSTNPTALTQTEPDLGRVTHLGPARARQAAARGQAPGLPLVLAAVGRVAARPGRREASRTRWPRAGTGSPRTQREYLDAFWDGADVELDGDPEIQQALRFALFHLLQASARGRGARDPGQGPDRARLRRPRLLGHRVLRAAGALLHPSPASRTTPCAGGTAPSIWRVRGPRSSGCAAPPSRGARSTARSARATGPRARPHSTSTPTSPAPSTACG